MESEISPILNEASSAAEKSILPIARLIPRHADAIYRVNLNVRGTQHGQTTSVMSLESSELPQCISVVWKVRDVTLLQVSATVRLHCFVSLRLAFFV